MSHFKRVTSTPPAPGRTNAVIMGRKTWDSIPPKFRPLDNRKNIILSRSGASVVDSSCDGDDNVLVCSSLDEAMEKLKAMKDVGDVFVIGGGQVYEESLKSGLVNKVVYTEVSNLPENTKFDTWFPELSSEEWDCTPFSSQKAQTEDGEEEKKTEDTPEATMHTDKKTGIQYQMLEYCRKSKSAGETSSDAKVQIEEGAHVNPEEMQYLEMCRDIIENGVERGDRTGTGTLSKFGTQMRFSLRDGTLPLLTTKRTFWRGVAEELLWFVKVCVFECALDENYPSSYE